MFPDNKSLKTNPLYFISATNNLTNNFSFFFFFALDALQQGASQFEQQAGKLKRKFWLQNLKMMIIMGVIGLVILAIIVGTYRKPKTS